MSKTYQIDKIINFVGRHPESLVSRRICRETLGEAVEQLNEEITTQLANSLHQKDSAQIDAYFVLIR